MCVWICFCGGWMDVGGWVKGGVIDSDVVVWLRVDRWV